MKTKTFSLLGLSIIMATAFMLYSSESHAVPMIICKHNGVVVEMVEPSSDNLQACIDAHMTLPNTPVVHQRHDSEDCILTFDHFEFRDD